MWNKVIPVTARTGTADDKTPVWPTIVAQWPDYDTYQAGRRAPVLAVNPEAEAHSQPSEIGALTVGSVRQGHAGANLEPIREIGRKRVAQRQETSVAETVISTAMVQLGRNPERAVFPSS